MSILCRTFTWFVFALAFFPQVASATDAPSEADVIAAGQIPVQREAKFNGVWEGVIKFDSEAFLDPKGTPSDGTRYRIEIHDAVVRVLIIEDGTPVEYMPGSVHIAAVMSNAVIYGTHSGGIWVESQTFTVTQKDDDTLLAEFSRVVNNVGVPLDTKFSKFSTRGFGEFKRVN